MTFTDEENAALGAMIKTFKCPVCGNTHIKFVEEVTFKPRYPAASETPDTWTKTATGRCTWCGWLLEFDMEQVMASYQIILKNK